VTEIARSNRHASLGNWSAAAMSVELTTSRVEGRDAIATAFESKARLPRAHLDSDRNSTAHGRRSSLVSK